jgi:elongation factor P hydroxylase
MVLLKPMSFVDLNDLLNDMIQEEMLTIEGRGSDEPMYYLANFTAEITR